jgi:hypothetical protein
VAGAAPAKFRRGPAAGLAGDVHGVVLGWLGTGLGRSWGWRWPVAGRAAAPNGGSRCGSNSGEVGAGEKGWSGSVSSVGAREGEGRFTLARGWPEIGARRGWPKGAGVRLGCGGKGQLVAARSSDC